MRQRINVGAGGGMLLKRVIMAPAVEAQVSQACAGPKRVLEARPLERKAGALDAAPMEPIHRRSFTCAGSWSSLANLCLASDLRSKAVTPSRVIVQPALASGWRKVLTLRRAQDAAPGAPRTRLAYRNTRTGNGCDVPATPLAKSSAIDSWECSNYCLVGITGRPAPAAVQKEECRAEKALSRCRPGWT
jgi:hypothetical protein